MAQIVHFEEVPHRRKVLIWLGVMCLLIMTMVAIGGVTRLTESGLSIVKWEPISGVIPPTNEQDWERLFEEYKDSPQFQQVNSAMSMSEFQSIFYWEYFHRLIGRMVGLAYLIPLLLFQFVLRTLPGSISRRLWFALFLGGAQGVMGWYMVQSGLVDLPRVSHYRLAVHLLLALVLFGYLLSIFLDLLPQRARVFGALAGREDHGKLKWVSLGLLGLITIQIFYGALVAGLRAGYGYNTFPLMGESWIPAGFLDLNPYWLNFIENVWSVQFVHRMIAWLILLFAVWFWRFASQFALSGSQRVLVYLVVVAVAVQFGLGVMTLLHVVPIPLAVTHQVLAIGLFGLVLGFVHTLRTSRNVDVRYSYVKFPRMAKGDQNGDPTTSPPP